VTVLSEHTPTQEASSVTSKVIKCEVSSLVELTASNEAAVGSGTVKSAVAPDYAYVATG
jgi:hypothetical protein